MTGARTLAPDPLLAWREEFPILATSTYLVSNSLGAMPRNVPDRLAEYAGRWATDGVQAWARGWWEMPVTVGDEIAPLIGAGAGEVAMVPNVTAAQALILSAIDFRGERDTIVMTALDFPSVRYVSDALAAKFGARVVVVPSEDGMSVSEEAIIAAIDERTALVAISHVLFRSAWIIDAGKVARAAHERGALFALDAFHSVGILPVDVKVSTRTSSPAVSSSGCAGDRGAASSTSRRRYATRSPPRSAAGRDTPGPSRSRQR